MCKGGTVAASGNATAGAAQAHVGAAARLDQKTFGQDSSHKQQQGQQAPREGAGPSPGPQSERGRPCSCTSNANTMCAMLEHC